MVALGREKMVKFEVGVTYYTRSICDHNTIVTLTVIRRTAKTITTRDKYGEVKTLRPSVSRDVEQVKPWGSYSMAPIVDATDTKVLRPDWEMAVAS
jgi:hypothetical protein